MKKSLVFQSDFTYKEGAVAAMYGVVKQVDQSIEIIDLTHEIPKFDIWSASFRLHQVLPFWPRGTVFVSVVDPGVGTTRKACVAKTLSGHFVVTPDNKTLSHINKFIGLESIREIKSELKFESPYKTSVFNGRDIFGYVGALLVSGQLNYDDIGPLYSCIERFELNDAKIENQFITGILEIQDPNFGNVWTNIPIHFMTEIGINEDDEVLIEIFYQTEIVLKQIIHYGDTFGSVKLYQPILYCNELECLALALNQSSYANEYNLGQGSDWTIHVSKETYE